MTTETQRVIEGAYKILSSEERWTRGVSARNSLGYFVHVNDPEACRFCTEGAIRRASAGKNIWWVHVVGLVGRCIPTNVPVPVFNDCPTTTHADILALLRNAHKLAGDGSPEVVE